MTKLIKYRSIINFYKKNLKLHGNTNKGLAWESSKKNELRYKTLLKIIFKEKFKKNFKILDFGCGISGFYLFLKKKINDFNYTGIDTSQQVIKYCKNKFKTNKYYCLDILEDNKNIGKFDITILNGIFTIKNNLNDKNMYSYIFKVLKLLKKKTKKIIIVNFMTDKPEWKNKRNFYPDFNILTYFIKKELSKNFYVVNVNKIFEKVILIKIK